MRARNPAGIFLGMSRLPEIEPLELQPDETVSVRDFDGSVEKIRSAAG